MSEGPVAETCVHMRSFAGELAYKTQTKPPLYLSVSPCHRLVFAFMSTTRPKC